MSILTTGGAPFNTRVRVTGTPRRLVLHVSGLREEQPGQAEELTGPPVSAAFKGPHHFPGEDSVNGREFWLNVAVPEHDIKKPWPDAPDDAYSANGHWGQYLTVIPSLDLVVVRTGDDRDRTFKFNTFLGLAVALVKP